MAKLRADVVPRATIVARLADRREEVVTKAKLATDADLGRLEGRSSVPWESGVEMKGAYVWLVLRLGPPGSFPHSEPPGYVRLPDADAWSLIEVDAITGAQRGATAIGPLGRLDASAWGALRDLAPPGDGFRRWLQRVMHGGRLTE